MKAVKFSNASPEEKLGRGIFGLGLIIGLLVAGMPSTFLEWVIFLSMSSYVFAGNWNPLAILYLLLHSGDVDI